MRSPADPYAGMDDTAVLARAVAFFKKAVSLPPGSIERAIQWAAYDTAKDELDRRVAAYMLARLREG